jgi:O-methyltransferase
MFDSFEGLPQAQAIDGKEALAWQNNKDAPGYFDNCKAEQDYCIKAMNMAGATNFEVHAGWFQNTIPQYGDSPIAILRLDGDWYDSIMVCLEGLFPKVREGGVIILDDYYTWDGCAKAVHDYLSRGNSPSRIFQWKNQVAYIIKKN